MTILKAITKDGKTEFFNLEKILTMTPSDDGRHVKILMGAGLYWTVKRDTIEILNYSYKDTAKVLRGENL